MRAAILFIFSTLAVCRAMSYYPQTPCQCQPTGPICASDYQTYYSYCDMKCQGGSSLTVIYNGRCDDLYPPNPAPQPIPNPWYDPNAPNPIPPPSPPSPTPIPNSWYVGPVNPPYPPPGPTPIPNPWYVGPISSSPYIMGAAPKRS